MVVASQWVKELKIFSEFQVEFNSFPIDGISSVHQHGLRYATCRETKLHFKF